jgi:hypothetical protein
MFGYACRDTEDYIPVAMKILQELSKTYDILFRQDKRFLPDGKAQITGFYENGKLKYIQDFVISYQNTEVEREETDKILMDICKGICEEYGIEIKAFHINPTGKFLIGGFDGDAGLTGRKIVVDNYQSFANVGGGCVDRETEYLSKDGWKKITEYKNGEPVAQWSNGKLEFVKGEFVKLPKAKMYYAKNRATVDMVLSGDHNFLYRTSKKNYQKVKFQEVVDKFNNSASGFRGEVPIYFTYDFSDSPGINLTDDEIRLQVAFCADGSLLPQHREYRGRIRVKKQYKKDNIEQLLNKTHYLNRVADDNGFNIYYLNPPIHTKSLLNCFKNVNLEQAKIICDEVVKWDGNRKNIFRTTIKEDADFIQFLFMSVYGKQSTIRIDNRVGQEYGQYERKSICYEVNAGKYRFTNAFRKGQHWNSRLTVTDYDDGDTYMYCINVPSHNLVLRRNNKVFITGNCFSGKDCTKVDRSAAYKARAIAIEFLQEHKDYEWCEVQLSYAIGLEKPLAIYIKTDKGDYNGNINWLYPECTPGNIIKDLKLLDVKYVDTAKFGHFGHSVFPWEAR